MSIPTPFNQLGTLGAGDYIQDGLLLLFDATREPAGTLNSLTNFATGEAVAFSQPLSADGRKIYLRRNHSDTFIPEIIEQAKAFEIVTTYDTPNEGFVRIAAFGRSGLVNTSINQTYPDFPRHMFIWKDHSSHEVIKDSVQLLNFYFTENSFELRDGELRNLHHGSGQTYFGDITLYGECILYSIRIYNRELTSAEKFHNWSVDKRKFGL